MQPCLLNLFHFFQPPSSIRFRFPSFILIFILSYFPLMHTSFSRASPLLLFSRPMTVPARQRHHYIRHRETDKIFPVCWRPCGGAALIFVILFILILIYKISLLCISIWYCFSYTNTNDYIDILIVFHYLNPLLRRFMSFIVSIPLRSLPLHSLRSHPTPPSGPDSLDEWQLLPTSQPRQPRWIHREGSCFLNCSMWRQIIFISPCFTNLHYISISMLVSSQHLISC